MEDVHMRVTMDMIDDKSKDLLYLTYIHGSGVVIENTQQPDELLVRAYNDKSQTVIAKAKDVKLLFENGYLHVLNGAITASKRLVLIAEQSPTSKYEFNRDLSTLQEQHPKVRDYKEESERAWQAQLEQERIEKERQMQLEVQKRAEEDAFLKTPKGKLVNAARKTRDALGNGVGSFIDMMDMFSRDTEEVAYNGAKKRQENNAYFGSRGYQNMRKASDKFAIKHHNN